MKYFLFALCILTAKSLTVTEELQCPPGCFCDKRKAGSLPAVTGHQDGLRVQCFQLEGERLDPGKLAHNTVQLDLSGYGLRSLGPKFFSNVKYLEKLDLSGNDIDYLDEDTFRNLGHLKHLDLSANKLTVLTMDTLNGLSKLERLKLNSNLLLTIEFGAFSHLTNIQKVDLADNPLLCDCNIAWMLGHWMEISGAKVRCGAPASLKNKLLKKLEASDLTCDVPMLPTLVHGTPANVLDVRIEPSRPQIVFQGDSLRLRCHVGLLSNDLLVRWYHNDELVGHEDVTSITNLGPSKSQSRPSLGHQSHLYIDKLEEADSGNWTCSALVDTGLKQNVSVGVSVISSGVVLCPASSTNTSKGLYHWGVTVAGHSASQPCHNASLGDPGPGGGMVEHSCHVSGVWGVLNDSACGHISDVTDKLYKFATMNDSDFDQNTLIQSAKMLLEFTSDHNQFHDGMDLVYLTTALENYLPYLTRSQELASLLVHIAVNTMRMSPDIIYQGQLLGHAASRLIATIANISRIVPAFQIHRPSLAVESFKVSPRSFAGITCSWYSEAGAGQREQEDRVFHCSENNVTVSSQGRTLLGSVQLPSTLYYQLELLERDINFAKNIMFTVFSNASLFPQIVTSKTADSRYRVISSCVLGTTVVAAEPFNLTQPVYVILKLKSVFSDTVNIFPAWWDSRANNGLGAWRPEFCKVMRARRDRSVFSCNRLGYFALLAKAGPVDRGRDTKPGLSSLGPVHSAVYISTVISVLLICATVSMFTLLYTKIRITKKLKHALPNFWMSLIFFLVFFALSISVQSARQLCQSVGVLLHYFTLTTCLWLTIVSAVVYKKLVNPGNALKPHSTNPYVVTPQDEVYIGVGDSKRHKNPLGQYYLIGWGVPLIICGITAGASLSQYTTSGYDWCYLSLAPAVGAILIPIVLISFIHLFFIFAILSFTQSKPGFETKVVSDGDTASSMSTLLVADTHHSHTAHVRVLLLVSVLLAIIFVSGSLSVTAPLPASLMSISAQHTIFSLLYSVLIILLALLTLTFYCLARQDIVLCKLPLGYTVHDETSNLVDLTSHKHMTPNNAPSYNMEMVKTGAGAGYPMVELGGSVLGPSTGARLKQCNLERESEDTDYHSVNNSQHLSRPRTGLSESEANKSMTDIFLGPSSKIKINNVNIHMANEPPHKGKFPWLEARSDWSMADTNIKSDWSVQSGQCYYPPPPPDCQVSPPSLPYPDLSPCVPPPLASHSVSASLPRRSGRRPRRRRVTGSGAILAFSDMERPEIYSSSRVSEVSSSTAASAMSRASKQRLVIAFARDFHEEFIAGVRGTNPEGNREKGQMSSQRVAAVDLNEALRTHTIQSWRSAF